MLPRGKCASDVIATKCLTDFSCGASFSTSGAKVTSKNTTLSSAWLAMYTIWSGKSRGLMVWITAPDPAAA